MGSVKTREDLIKSPDRNEPHIVILGAGASKAAFKDRDAKGRPVPLMEELPDILGDRWRKLIKQANLDGGNFEAQFAQLSASESHRDGLDEIKNVLWDYFASLEIPDHTTIYDYLVLGLREKDMIATFNWDPFLVLSHVRNRGVCRLPEIRFLHGCVRYASCVDHDILGQRGEVCPTCRKALVESPIIFPYADKDYGKDWIIDRDWMAVTERLKSASHLTIFGYSGPKSDYKAKKLLLDRWKQTPTWKFNHVEIIDIADEGCLRRRWKDFIPFHHAMIFRSFWESTIAKWPRRTVEYKFAASLYATPSEKIGPMNTKSLRSLQEWHAEIAKSEKEIDEPER